MRISGWSSDVYSSDLDGRLPLRASPDGRRWPCNLPASERYPASTPAAALTQSRICGRACNWFFSHHPGSFAADIIVGRPASGNYRGSDRPGERSEERRVGKECVRTCRSRWLPSHLKKKLRKTIKDEG